MKASKGVGVQWIGANLDRAHERLDSALGFFDEDRLCRLQEVMTAQPARGKGLATLLLREVAARAVQRGLNYVGLLAEDRSDGHRLYQKLGFRELDRDVTLMHY
jgi:GNAT superfamily N-acetyltransferase